MISLTKRVNARGGVSPVAIEPTVDISQNRGPRNQPKRKGKKK
jgi:hypothetical protein